MNQAKLTTQKLSNHQTRRHAMQAKRLTFVSLLVIVAIIGGCSSQNTLTGPATSQDEILTSTQPEESNQPLTKRPTASQVSSDDKKFVAVTGIISQAEYPDGCIYVKTDRDGAFELEFKSESAVPDLSKGSVKATVAGWINPEAQSKCTDSWVLEVDKLQVLDSGKEANHAEASAQAIKPQARNTKPGPMMKLRGRYGATEAGCLYLKNDKNAVELFFVPGVCPNIKEGTLIEVTGVYSLLTVSACHIGPRFNVYYFEELESKTQEEANENIVWKPINNPYTQKAENHRADF